jgi:hypothetical protein
MYGTPVGGDDPELSIITTRAIVDEFVASAVSQRPSFAFLLWEPPRREVRRDREPACWRSRLLSKETLQNERHL